jgi:hypothetical protein
MEGRFGYDFSKVRVHSGPTAEQSAADVNAHAYTVGHNIVFSAGQFAPGTSPGRRLLAHELTHVVQQSRADGNRAAPALQRKPARKSLNEAADPIEEEDYPAYAWYEIHSASFNLDPPPLAIRAIVRENTNVDREAILEASFEEYHRNYVKGGTIRPSYFVFRHHTKGVIARAFAELTGYPPGVAPKGGELLKESYPYKFYAFLPRAGNHGNLYSFSMPLSSAPPPTPLPERQPVAEKTEAPAEQAEATPAKGTVTWMELDEGVFGVIVEGGLTLKTIAAYVSGHPDVPDALADLNGLALTTPIPEGKPVMIPYQFVERQETLKKIPEPVRSRIDLLQKLRAEKAAHERFAKVRGPVGLIPLTTEIIRSVVNELKKLGYVVAYVIAFIGGLIHGLLSSVWDAVSGAAQMIYSIVKSIISGTPLADLKKLASTISSISWEGVKEALGEWAAKWDAKLKSSSPWTAGHAHGYLVGYVLAEVIMLLLSGGLIEELKGAIWATRLGEALKESQVVRTIDQGLSKAAKVQQALGSKFDKAVEAAKKSPLAKVVETAQKTGAAVVWTAEKVTSALKLPADIASSVASKIAAHAEKLRPFFRRIEELSEQAKRWLFGCHSPCDWEPDAVVSTMKRVTNEKIETLATAKPSKAALQARQRAVETEAGIGAVRREMEVTKKEVEGLEKDLPTARQLADEPGGAELLSKMESDLQTAREKHSRLEEDLEIMEGHAATAATRSRNIEVLEQEIADVDRQLNEIYARNRQYTGQMNKADREAVRKLENKKKDLVGEHQKQGQKLSTSWLDELRRGSPGEGAADKAVQNLKALPKELRADNDLPFDVTDPGRALLTKVSPDHIYPIEKIFQERGFDLLRPDQQRKLLELKENYFPLRLGANQSKRSRTMAEWFMTPEGRKIPVTLRKPLEEAEKRAQERIRHYIANPHLLR